MFRFEPNYWLELVNEGQKSAWAKPFEDFATKEKEAKLKEEERKKNKQLL